MSVFLRVLKPGQLTLAGISFAIYGLLTTWQFGLLLVVILATHEYGHLVAMQRLNMRPKGMFFIPLLGAVSLREDLPATRGKEVLVSIAGPAAGAIFALSLCAAYLITGASIFAAAAVFAAAINLLNLFPVGILDGGHILKEIVFSVAPQRQMPLLIFGLALGLWVTVWVGPDYFAQFFMFGSIWVFALRGTIRRLQKIGRPGGTIYDQEDLIASKVAMSPRATLAAFTAYIGLALLLAGLVIVMKHEPGAYAMMKTLFKG